MRGHRHRLVNGRAWEVHCRREPDRLCHRAEPWRSAWHFPDELKAHQIEGLCRFAPRTMENYCPRMARHHRVGRLSSCRCAAAAAALLALPAAFLAGLGAPAAASTRAQALISGPARTATAAASWPKGFPSIVPKPTPCRLLQAVNLGSAAAPNFAVDCATTGTVKAVTKAYWGTVKAKGWGMSPVEKSGSGLGFSAFKTAPAWTISAQVLPKSGAGKLGRDLKKGEVLVALGVSKGL